MKCFSCLNKIECKEKGIYNTFVEECLTKGEDRVYYSHYQSKEFPEIEFLTVKEVEI